MYRSKKDVDKHVEGLISKLSLKEFKSRAYSVARLYFEVADYTSCQKYVEQYLSHKDNNAAAHKLLGQALQKLGQKEKALEQYKTSLDIDPTQTSLIMDICEILAEDEVSVDPGRAKYWSEKAEATFPRHPVTFRLREKLMASDNQDPEALINLLTAELQVRPKDPTLHARLLRLYLQSNKIKEAFDHSCSVEFGGSTFYNIISWYESLSELLKHQSHDTSSWLYQLLLLTVRERVCTLSLTETPSGTSKSLVESNDLLHLYDQALEKVSQIGAPAGFAEFHTALLQHHRGQFALHAATFLLKKAKKDQLSWRDATKSAAPLMMIAWHTVPLDTKVSWLARAPEKLQTAVNRWYLEATYRCSQAGHYIVSNIQDKTQAFLDVVSQECSGSKWKNKMYHQIFNSRDHLAKIKMSHFVSDAVSIPPLRLPRKVEVEAYDADAQRQTPNSLHHFVWMLLNYKNLTQFQCTLFDMLTPKSRNFLNCGPETLNKSDMLAFLFCAAQTAKQQKTNSYAYESTQKPKVLPANITDLLCTLNQMKWWDCAYKFSQNQLGTELTDIRAILSRGIEVVRCVDNHGLDAELLCQLGRLFSDLAEKSTTSDEKKTFESRAVLYYSSAIPLLEKVKSRLVIKVPEKRMFDYTHKELSNKVLNGFIDESKVYVAVNYLKECEYEKALDTLSDLKSPQAYYQISQTYKKMAVDEQNVLKDITDNEAKSKFATLLTKSRTYAYKTIDRLKDIHEDTKHPLFAETQELIEEIETHLNRIDTDLSGTIVNEVDGKYSSDENVSSVGSEHVTMHSNNLFRNLSSTPKHPSTSNATNYRTAVESQFFDNSRIDTRSLERIEKEIKSLQKRDGTISSFMEQTKSWFEENKNLGNQIISTINSNIQNTTDQFKLLKISVDQVKDQIDECRTECKDVGDLKRQVAELKKEVNKLKKATPEQNINENELYNLDEDCRTNDGTSNFASQLPFPSPQVPIQFNQRLLPPFPMPPNPYQFYGQNLYNLYNQYSQFSQTTTVPGAPPLFDPTRAQMNFPGVFATPEQMYPDVTHLIPPVVPSVPPMPSVPTATVTVPPPVPQPVAVSKPSTQPKDTTRNLPVNVVITSSDPLPTPTTAPQPVLSVTIPPKHIKGTPHNYQIPMPATSDGQVKPPSIPSILGSIVSSSNTKPFTSWNQANAFKTAFSAETGISGNASADSLSFSFLDTSKSSLFDNSISVVDGQLAATGSPNTSLNKSRTLSERSNTSVENNYDPCPDFKPIVPLPAEVKVTTGEEDEVAIFSARAKLFRFVDKQWKERGIGEMKLLKHKSTGKVRVLMRREQVHKICANHLITPEIEIQPMKNENKAYFWVANDFADETVVLEKFCVRFKTPDIAKEFFEAFEKARQDAKSSSQKKEAAVTPKLEQTPTKKDVAEKPADTKTNKTVIGGFTFSSTPAFKSVKEQTSEVKPVETNTTKANPFSGISFKPNNNTTSQFSNLFNSTIAPNNSFASNSPIQQQSSAAKLDTSDTVEEFEPTVEFKPVVPLPALVDHKTGEEDEAILFEHRAKLFRFESTTKEWKERGLGNMKILVQKDNNQKLRLLMRREQVMKVCCNHTVTKEMTFKKMPNMDKAVTWCAKDFSEGELVPETFCLRFKTVHLCDEFIAAVKTAQLKLNDETKAAKEEQNAAKQINQNTGFGDKFKPKAGSWQCDGCYTNNLESFSKCACCEQARPLGGKAESISVPSSAAPLNWGDQYKPKVGTWECKVCYIRNESSIQYCSACNSPKDPSIPKEDATPAAAGDASKFNFGIPFQTAATLQVSNTVTPVPSTVPTSASGWGDKFKPKVGSWECKQCFVRNEGNLDQCSACTSPKDSNAVKKEPQSLFGAAQSGSKFNFGMPVATPTSQPATIFDGTGAHKFSFGVPSTQESSHPTFGIQTPVGGSSVIFATPKKPAEQSVTPLNFSLKKNEDLTVTVTPVKLTPTAQNSSSFGGKEGGTFDFVFKPKTPAKGKSPVKSPKSEKGDDSDDNEYASEDEGNHIHFSPVIPLPDKVEVVTGEENEDELYGHRAKLYRFISGEWKERGIGIVKILKNKDTGKLRVLMRREQVLKICLNHALTVDIIYTPKEDKSWMFAANDFSEGELSLQQFCLRFKNKEIATAFREAIDSAREGKIVPLVKERDSSDDVVFVKEIQATKEEKQRAKELMLPENFFNYKNKEPCQGCRGCDDKEDAKSTSSDGTSGLSTPVKNLTQSYGSPAVSVYGTPNNFNKTMDTSIFRTPLESIGSNNNSTPMFGFNNKNSNKSTNKENPIAPKSTFFGENGGSKSILGTPPVTNDTLTPTSIRNSILAAPKLSPDVIKDKDNKVTESKSLFGSEPVSANMTAKDKKTMFGNAVFGQANTTTDSKSIFGNSKLILDPVNSSDNKSVFGSTASTDAKSVFSSPSADDAKSVFNSTNSAIGIPVALTNNTGQSLFAQTTTAFGNQSIFGNKNTDTSKPEVKSLFGGEAELKPTNLFSFPVQGSLFGPSAANEQNKPAGNIFGSGGGSIFGSNIINAAPTFGNSNSVIASANQPSQDAITASRKTNEQANVFGAIKSAPAVNDEKETPFKVDNTLSFAALSSSGPGFAAQKKADFSWEGAGQQLFTAAQKAQRDMDKSKDDSGAGEAGDGDAAPDEEYDPHYEPIVPLPEKIVVTTGEEDEQKVFGERCKLYRYDEKTKEWKERGIGEMKLLYHPERNSYRMLLRREQVHKAVLNMLLFPDLELLPMKNSDRAWTWAGRNYAETPAGEQETLAVRFKTVALAAAFHEKVVDCVRKVQAAAAQAIREQKETEKLFDSVAPLRLPKHLEVNARADGHLAAQAYQSERSGDKIGQSALSDSRSSQSANGNVQEAEKPRVQFQEPATEEEHADDEGEDDDYEHNYEDYENYEDYYNEDDDTGIYHMCSGHVVVAQGDTQTECEEAQLQLMYDHELNAPKLLVTDANTGEILLDMIVYTETEFQMSENSCTWSGTDLTSELVDKTVTATFQDAQTLHQFYDSCETSKAAIY